MRFECLECSDCCQNLLQKKFGAIMGLSLMVEETVLFSHEHIFPSIGTGQYEQPKKIITYQLDLNTCPHLQGRRCAIYDKRPLRCQAFPMEIEKINPTRILIDYNCRWFKEKVVAKGMEKKMLTHKERIIALEEIEACWELFQHKNDFRKSTNKWMFDLKRKAWFQVR